MLADEGRKAIPVTQTNSDSVVNLQKPEQEMMTSGKPRRVDAERSSLAQLLNIIRDGDADTRQELERVTGLGRAVISDRLATLFAHNLLVEGELGQTTGGRAPRTIRFNANVGLLLVATIEPSRLGVAIADLSGNLVAEHHEAADMAIGPSHMLKRLITLFDWVLEQHQGTRAVWGIGIAAPGPVEEFPLASPRLRFLPGWDEFPIVDHLLAKYHAPVWMRSGVQMMAYGEYKTGNAAGTGDLIYVNLSQNISAGIISEGHLHRGAQGGAGLIGHVAVGDGHDLRCSCGNVGCLETVAGVEAIGREGLALANAGSSRHLADALASEGLVTAGDVGMAAQSGDSAAAEILARAGKYIGTALASLVNAFNPSLISLGGDVGQTDDILLASIREAVYRRSHPLVTRDLRIQRSAMGSSAGLSGAALVVADAIFESASVVDWISSGSPAKAAIVSVVVARAEQQINGPQTKPLPPAAA